MMMMIALILAAQTTELRSIAALVQEIRRADYEDDRPSLQRSFAALEPLAGTGRPGLFARYWRGFAVWRRALNGFNDGAPAEELEADLTGCVREMDAALAADAGFVEAEIGAAGCEMTLLYLHRDDPGALLRRWLARLSHARSVAPDNPRLSWVLGASIFNRPGDPDAQAKGLEEYKRGLMLARKQKVTDPLAPAWGEPELEMNLAWSLFNGKAPDLAQAEQHARAALRLVPRWHYVRDLLLPQIVHARRGE